MGNLADQTLEQLSSKLIRRSCRKGNFVFSQGEVVDHLYFVEKGKMEIFKSDANGTKLTLWFVEAGEVFCLANMYAEHSFANACCAEDTKLYCLAKKKLGEILAGNNKLSMQFIQCMSRKLAVYSELIDDFAFLKMTARVAKTILISQRLDEKKPSYL
ncbi:MAG: cyclic nucleotide-binding domain-containing protein [Desulfobulbaceae bacterium]|nr:cyclic nucleotide-binding domain-containing protein [Desulfobulbaceae bacterium]